MDSIKAFAMGSATKGNERMVFDWCKAARLIVERKPREASAGLRGDWEWTGGTIFSNGAPDTESYTYLSSTWATPELDLDGERVDCFVMQGERPDWNSDTRWPKEALALLK